MKKYQYEKNIENINAFMKTDKYKELENTIFKNKDPYKLIKYIQDEKIYIDPDAKDVELYKDNIIDNEKYELIVKYSKKKEITELHLKEKDTDIILSLDCVSGWKPIFAYHFFRSLKNNKCDELKTWLYDYKIIRKPDNYGHLVWPKHEIPTINTTRFSAFGDRVDYTLYDLKIFFESDYFKSLNKCKKDLKKLECKMKSAYINNTFLWLIKFENFEDFINKMRLKRWCVNKDNKYEVIDLVKSDLIKKEIETVKDINGISFNYQHGYQVIEKNIDKYEKYLENLKYIVDRNNKNFWIK